MDLISVIVPVYNTQDYLNRCVDSIINQTYRDLEIILIDDGSTDNSPKICDNYSDLDNRIKVIHKENEGPSSARNMGVEVAKGDYIAFVDSDDWVESDIYQFCVDISKKTNSDVVDFKPMLVTELNESKRFSDTRNYKVITGKEILRDYLRQAQVERSPFSVCRKLYKRHLFDDINFPTGKRYEDIVTNF
jgi:glycosyltransferase involved in cell wall biosynthesis